MNWWLGLVKIVNTPDWNSAQIADWCGPWINKILETAGGSAKLELAQAFTLIDGNYFDAVPFNLIRDHSGAYHFIDQEWTLTAGIELQFLIYRGLKESLFKLSCVAPPQAGTPTNIHRLIKAALAQLGLLISDGDLRRFEELGQRIHNWAYGKNDELIEPNLFEWTSEQSLVVRHELLTLQAGAAELEGTHRRIAELEEALEAWSNQLARLEADRGSACKQTAEINQLKEDLFNLRSHSYEMEQSLELALDKVATSNSELVSSCDRSANLESALKDKLAADSSAC